MYHRMLIQTRGDTPMSRTNLKPLRTFPIRLDHHPSQRTNEAPPCPIDPGQD